MAVHDDSANTHERRVTATQISVFNGFVRLSFSRVFARFCGGCGEWRGAGVTVRFAGRRIGLWFPISRKAN
jgi:hypothetical protein